MNAEMKTGDAHTGEQLLIAPKSTAYTPTFSIRIACCVSNAYEVHDGWVFITLSVLCWGAAEVAASEEGELQSLCSSPVSDISEELEVGQAWDSEGSGEQAVTQDQKDREKV